MGPPCEQTEIAGNITFRQLRWQVVKKTSNPQGPTHKLMEGKQENNFLYVYRQSKWIVREIIICELLLGIKPQRWEHHQPIILAIFPWKLHENEKKKLDRDGGGGPIGGDIMAPPPCLDPPMRDHLQVYREESHPRRRCVCTRNRGTSRTRDQPCTGSDSAPDWSRTGCIRTELRPSGSGCARPAGSPASPGTGSDPRWGIYSAWRVRPPEVRTATIKVHAYILGLFTNLFTRSLFSGVSFPVEVEFEFTTWTWVQATPEMLIDSGCHRPSPFHCRLPFQQWPELKLRWQTQTLPRLYRIHVQSMCGRKEWLGRGP